MSKKIVRYLSVLLAVSILFSGISLQITTAFADVADDSTVTTGTVVDSNVSDESDIPDYVEYFNKLEFSNKATSNVKVPLDAYVVGAVEGEEANVADVTFDANTLDWNKGDGSVTWTFDVPETALYNLQFVWDSKESSDDSESKVKGSGIDVVMGVMIDGKYLFDGSDEIVLSRLWKNKSEIKKDKDGKDIETQVRIDAQGNEYAPEQLEIDGNITTVIRDFEGAVIDPFEFALTAGTHTITIVEPEQSIKISNIEFIAPEKIESYEKVSAGYELKDLDTDIIYIEGENADVKSSNSIIPKSNNSDAGMTSWDGSGSNSYLTKINFIGGSSWQTTGSSISWTFNVKESGYYYINTRYKQSELVNGESYRWLKIDGKTPFEEAKNISFPYDTKWKYKTIADANKNPYYVYFEKGDHTISMEVTVGSMSDYFYELSKIVDILGDEYIKIVMITSETPDLNRDYDLDKQIPGFLDTLKSASERLGTLSKNMTSGTGKASQAVATIDNMKRVVDNMINSPYIAQQYVSEYYSNYTSLSSWLYDMIEMPLAIDQIQVVPKGKEYVNNNANIFQKIGFSASRLVASFTNDYSLTNDEAKENADTIRLWVNWGQDQAAALNSLIQDSFTPVKDYWYDSDNDGVGDTPIKVQVEIVNASLINGILAGNYPDMSLQMARTEPVNLGIRGALADLSTMPGFDETIKQFQSGLSKEQIAGMSDEEFRSHMLKTGAVAPYSYNGKVYALPDTQNFMLMFYRTDVLEELGLLEELGDPNEWTWDDFLYSATIIQRNNMNVYVPFTQITTSTTVNAGIGNLHLYPTLMWQHGLKIYNDEGTATNIQTKEALDVFEQWTDFYLKNDFLKEADFYNRLRVGVMPLGIAAYTTYMTLYSTAPEIRGRWSVAMVPGTEKDGVINRSVAGSGTGCTIIKKSNKQQQAWQFLKWWTSEDTQTRYNNNLQSMLGMIGRNAVSNTNAFNNLGWDRDDLVVLNNQWQQVKEVQEVPGSYDVTRSIDQAFWAVLEDKTAVKDAVVKWSKSADKEIQRKIKEYEHVLNQENQ